MSKVETHRTERLGARVPPELKALLQHAADLWGQSLSDFVLTSARAAAEKTIREREVVQLTARDSRLLAEALLSPPSPNARLRAAFEDYHAFTGQGE